MTRPAPAEARAQAVEIIGDSIFYALGLKEALQEERKALESEDLDALHAAVDGKSACVENLSALDARRIDLCEELGYTMAADQMQKLIDYCDEDNVVSRRWEDLMVIAAESSALNMTNGAIIRLRQQQFESSLSVLRGVSPGSDTYGRNGSATGHLDRGPLVQA
ncbi:MAG: flagellar protein FlgN [Woeseiaceae bacterium]|nr:flagellar protein FlgN [Woeseiaceae bacterium]